MANKRRAPRRNRRNRQPEESRDIKLEYLWTNDKQYGEEWVREVWDKYGFGMVECIESYDAATNKYLIVWEGNWGASVKRDWLDPVDVHPDIISAYWATEDRAMPVNARNNVCKIYM